MSALMEHAISALILATAKALAMLSLTAFFVVGIACAAWKIIYYGCNCRRNPIGKTAMLTAAILWVLSAAIINFM